MMHDIAARLLSEMAAARAAISSSYSRLWREPESLNPSASADATVRRGEAGRRGDAGDKMRRPKRGRPSRSLTVWGQTRVGLRSSFVAVEAHREWCKHRRQHSTRREHPDDLCTCSGSVREAALGGHEV